MFPIDAIIGKIYPIFGAILLFSAVGVFAGLFVKGYPLLNLWDDWQARLRRLPCGYGSTAAFSYGDYFANGHFLPIFFVTWPAASCPASTPPRPLSSPAP